MTTPEIRRAKPLLGTIVEICTACSDVGRAHEAIDAAFEAIQRVHSLMSAFEAGSDVGRLNHHGFIVPQSVHPWTYEVIRLSKELSTRSKGCFDITIGSGKDRCGACDDIILNDDKLLISYRCPLKIDLGGIAKGFAVDRAIEMLRAFELSSGTVNAGGDLRTFGDAMKPIRIRLPNNPTLSIEALQLQNGAVATSANYFIDGKRLPIIDPFRKQHWNSGSSITVIARECVLADALTKVVALSGDAASGLLCHYDAEAVVISRSDKAR